jgi:uncharacterized HhH-GPD family protein
VAITKPAALHFTGNPEADELIARDPMALLIGFALDQQVSVEKAFTAPLELIRRVGTIEADALAGMEPAKLEQAFRAKPALHRYPGTMARRTQELAATIASEYGGDAERVWTEAEDGRDLERRLLDLPGIGPMKARGLLAVLAKRFGLELPGFEEVLPTHPTLGDVDSPETREEFQAKKRAYKASLKAKRAAK